MFYRQFIINNNLTTIQIGLGKIKEKLHLLEGNVTNMTGTIEGSILNPLVEDGCIISYRKEIGQNGLKCFIRVPPKKKMISES
jgi:hypothetical protein